MAKRKKTFRKINWNAFEGMTEDEIYATHIRGWENLSEKDKDLCKKVNQYRVNALCLPPIIHPDVISRSNEYY